MFERKCNSGVADTIMTRHEVLGGVGGLRSERFGVGTLAFCLPSVIFFRGVASSQCFTLKLCGINILQNSS